LEDGPGTTERKNDGRCPELKLISTTGQRRQPAAAAGESEVCSIFSLHIARASSPRPREWRFHGVWLRPSVPMTQTPRTSQSRRAERTPL